MNRLAGGWHALVAMRRARVMALGAIAISLGLGGCAVTRNQNGNMTYGFDEASVFGTTVDTFKLADGSEGVLRRSNGKYTVKLERYMRVLPLGNAMTARLVRSETIGDRSVVVFETQENNCPFKYVLYAIQGSDVLGWTFGNCQDRPRADLVDNGRALVFDFPGNGRLVRHTYMDSRLLQSAIPVPPGVDIRRKPFADGSLKAIDDPADANRFAPLPPQNANTNVTRPAATNTPKRRQKTPAPTQAPAPTVPTAPAVASNSPPSSTSGGRTIPAPPAGPVTSNSLSFATEEVKPVRVDLRN